MPPKLPPHVVQVRNKVGRPYLYLMKYRGTPRAEKAIRLPDDPRQPEFWTEYARLMHAPTAPVKSNTVAKLIEAWHASPEWKQMKPKTRVDWERYCRRIKDSWGAYEVTRTCKHLNHRDERRDRQANDEDSRPWA